MGGWGGLLTGSLRLILSPQFPCLHRMFYKVLLTARRKIIMKLECCGKWLLPHPEGGEGRWRGVERGGRPAPRTPAPCSSSAPPSPLGQPTPSPNPPRTSRCSQQGPCPGESACQRPACSAVVLARPCPGRETGPACSASFPDPWAPGPHPGVGGSVSVGGGTHHTHLGAGLGLQRQEETQRSVCRSHRGERTS